MNSGGSRCWSTIGPERAIWWVPKQARAPADGYTLLVAPNPVLTANTLLFGKLNYDPGKDFAPITQLVRIRQGIFAATTVPATTLKELVTLAKSKPGSLNYGSNGPGSPQHLALEFFKGRFQ